MGGMVNVSLSVSGRRSAPCSCRALRFDRSHRWVLSPIGRSVLILLQGMAYVRTMQFQRLGWGMIWECTYLEKNLLSCSDGQVFQTLKSCVASVLFIFYVMLRSVVGKFATIVNDMVP